MPRRLTREEYISRARDVHGDKYDYSRLVYVDLRTTITIGCEVHGWVTNHPEQHLKGGGCWECANTTPKPGKSLGELWPNLVEEWHPDNEGTAFDFMPRSKKNKKWICSKCNHQFEMGIQARTDTRSSAGTKETGRGCTSCSGHEVHTDGSNSLAVEFPEIASEFDLEKNAPLTPETIRSGTSKMVDWICSKCSHEWNARLNSRTLNGNGCNACSNHKLHIDGRNSLASMFPEITKDFHPTKNAPLTPDAIVAGTNRMLWWSCHVCDNEWRSMGSTRIRGHGCRFCSSRPRLHSDGRNSMAKTHPQLAAEFHPTKNAPLTPDTIVAGVRRTLWWICSKCSHEWPTPGYHRANNRNCPACAPTGFQPDLPASYYVIEVRNNDGDVILYKGGISGDVENRFAQHKSVFAANDRSSQWTLRPLESVDFKLGTDAQVLETRLLKAREIRAPNIEDVSKELFLQNPLDYARDREWI
ncbi:zinc-ribbon domain-containing protein [Candidatus Poseidoniales archaeon]|nr:zinc-ribbon domain-containing protein [Candidatus Poseidoniales archaeon]